MRILIADDELANSQLLRSLFGGGAKSKNQPKATAGIPEIGRVVVARSQPRTGNKGRGKAVKGRAGSGQPQNSYLDLGDQPEQAAALLDALGISLLNRGMLDEGSVLIELALKIRRKFYGNDHPATALSLNSYSRVQRERGDYAGATESANDALRINRRVFGDKGYPVAPSLLELGLAQLLQGLFTDAITSAETGLTILRNLDLYESDPNSTRLMDLLGRAQCARGQVDAAAQTYETLLELDQKQLGTRKHPKYATHLANFGLVLEAQKKRSSAIKAYLNAIDLYENTLNRGNHPNLIDTYANLGSLLRTPPAKLKEAGRYLEKALQLGIAVRGDSHLLVGNDYANLARWQYDSGARDAATKGFNKALDIYSQNIKKRALPADHFFIAEALTWQGRILVEAGTLAGGKQAEPLLRKAREIWPVQLGSGTVGEAMATGYLGRALALQGNQADDACQLLCSGYRALQENPQASPAVIKQFAAWIKQQQCDCGPAQAAK
ncbi:MAG: tetratricopeptide repeat protein [Steroidobacter sp.]